MQYEKENQIGAKNEHWVSCEVCLGLGKKSKRRSKQQRQRGVTAPALYEQNNGVEQAPKAPQKIQKPCKHCLGTGLVRSNIPPVNNPSKYPHIAIVGGGIGGIALAVACLHRGIPFTLFERDHAFAERAQGYGLTLQQASKALRAFGIAAVEGGVVSTKHIVHAVDGKVLGEWGKRKWMGAEEDKTAKRNNIHIPRQVLRQMLIQQLGGEQRMQWGHQLIDLHYSSSKVNLTFQVDDQLRSFDADLVIGADGIRSTIRRKLIGEDQTPLHYLGCMVVLGICPLENLRDVQSPLLDGETVFQTANGTERMYMMPYTKDSVMWQLSFPMDEEEAKALSLAGPKALKEEACRRIQWHNPIPEILDATQETTISGYPVYDRSLFDPRMLSKAGPVSLLGDAVHPMSPFKGQGANQALLDALSLVHQLTTACQAVPDWKTLDLRQAILSEYEAEVSNRSSAKVKGSAAAAAFLHSDVVLQEGDQTIGAKWKSRAPEE